MRFLLLITAVSVAFAEDAKVEANVKVEAKEELKPEESAHSHNVGHSFSDGLELMRHREQSMVDARQSMLNDDYRDGHSAASHGLDQPGPVILRTPSPLPHDEHPDIAAQNRIIADVFSPDYHQPTWVLDYRYLKTGGRDYTRGPGGQVLILPKGVRSKENNAYPDYDAYLEHLRLSHMASRQREESHRHRDHESHNRGPHDYGHARYGGEQDRHHHGYDERDYDRNDGHGHGQTMWQKY